MEINEEITKHLEWIEGVSSLLGSSELDDVHMAAISRHDRCALGHWLESPAAEDRVQSQALADLRQRHARFHQLAGELITAAQRGNEREALALQQAFIETSHQLILDLKALSDNPDKTASGAGDSG